MNRLTGQIHPASKSVAKKSTWKYLAGCFASIAMLVALAPGVWGQDNATINGSVTDPTGAVVPSATINLTNTATGQVRTETSNGAGTYRFANLGIGTYTLNASGTGFEK